MSTYSIVNVADMQSSYWDDVIESASTIRVDTDTGNTCIIKWSGSEPSWLSGISGTAYTHAELFAEMDNQGIW